MWTTNQDVVDRWVNGSVPADDTQISTLIADAEDTVLQTFSDIQTRIDNASLPIERVKKVVARMVIRHLRNPNGHRSTSQGAGPFQQSITFGGEEPGAMYLTDEEKRELSGPSTTRGKALSVDMTPQTFTSIPPDVWEPMR